MLCVLRENYINIKLLLFKEVLTGLLSLGAINTHPFR